MSLSTLSPQLPSVPTSILGEVLLSGDAAASALPLEHTDVVAQILGTLASVRITQRFANPFTTPVELIYRFPLPHRAAVSGFEVRIGERTIKGKISEKEAAQQQYHQAIQSGQRAGLATQERPNLYTVRLGNVLPGETITAMFRYQESVRIEAARYEFVIPFGVTPRYTSPSQPEADQADTHVPIGEPGTEFGTVDINVAVDAGCPVGEPTSPSHDLAIRAVDERRFSVGLPDHVIPNKDFVLRYDLRNVGAPIHGAAWLAEATSAGKEGWAFVTLVPPVLSDQVIEAPPREFIFVLDRSGSMHGEPIRQACDALKAALRTLNPNDTFRLITFDNRVESFRAEALIATEDITEEADAFLDTIEGRGGTELVTALDAAFSQPRDPIRRRHLVLFTDGGISAEKVAFDRVRSKLEDGRIFTFGIGPSVNRYLVSELARIGRGAAEFLTLTEGIEEPIIRFQDRLAFPALTDISLTWEGVTALDRYPEVLPDLYYDQTLDVVAKVGWSGSSRPMLVLHGKRGDETVTLRVPLGEPIAETAIARLWARSKVERLLDQPGSVRAEIQQRIVELACAHQLLTPFTAFVAVDEGVVTDGQPPQQVSVAGPLPEGLSASGFYAPAASAPLVAPMPAGGVTVFNMTIGSSLAPQNSGWEARSSWSTQALSAGSNTNAANVAPTNWENLSGPVHMKHSWNVQRLAWSGRSAKSLPPTAEAFGADAAELPRSRRAVTLHSRRDLIRVLARRQRRSGAWGTGQDSVELTAVALVVFAREGETPQRGSFRQILRRSLAWLVAQQLNGEAEYFRAWALAEIQHAQGEAVGDILATLATLAPSALADVVRARVLAMSGQAATVPEATEVRQAIIVSRRSELDWPDLATV